MIGHLNRTSPCSYPTELDRPTQRLPPQRPSPHNPKAEADQTTMAPPPANLPPSFTFTMDETVASLTEFTVPAQTWLSQHAPRLQQRHISLAGLAVSTFVFNPAGHVLLLQRASHDSMPDRWEPPGGAVDNQDASVLHAAARELWEESGLMVTRFRGLVDHGQEFHVFYNRNRTRCICRFAFLVDVDLCDVVRLDPQEHQAFAWATEHHVRSQTLDGHRFPITTPDMRALILESFHLRRALDGT
ncbi:hypothetical protein XA68_11129 [Ophiocordyceps unilateralis]|uniref:Nudix hydrolase domain-containing protein n=1 Tax=Ophiocordyceps unilateralis TaxID=268505 RepID=A0A2A9PG53_OPHUN|nr:hypothetical protein XA68_11129 [Ophiocordyceps unilateralis]